jgi:hypothetical protein
MAWHEATRRLLPPFPDDAIVARGKRCVVVLVRIQNRYDRYRVDDAELAELMGRQYTRTSKR